MKLEESLIAAFEETKIDEPQKGKIYNFLDKLKETDFATYTHSIRVGILASQIAKFMHIDPKPALYSGLLHDIGKTRIDTEILRKKEKFTDEDMEKVKNHVIAGYSLLKETFPFTAELMVRHHTYQQNAYPKKMPKNKINFSQATKSSIAMYSRIIALADFYDALTTRRNEKYVGNMEKSMLELMIAENRDQEYLIKELSKEKIFEF